VCADSRAIRFLSSSSNKIIDVARVGALWIQHARPWEFVIVRKPELEKKNRGDHNGP